MVRRGKENGKWTTGHGETGQPFGFHGRPPCYRQLGTDGMEQMGTCNSSHISPRH